MTSAVDKHKEKAMRHRLTLTSLLFLVVSACSSDPGVDAGTEVAKEDAKQADVTSDSLVDQANNGADAADSNLDLVSVETDAPVDGSGPDTVLDILPDMVPDVLDVQQVVDIHDTWEAEVTDTLVPDAGSDTALTDAFEEVLEDLGGDSEDGLSSPDLLGDIEVSETFEACGDPGGNGNDPVPMCPVNEGVESHKEGGSCGGLNPA